MPEIWRFGGRKQSFLRLFRRYLHFSDFQTLSDLDRSKSVLGSFLGLLTKNWPKNMYHAAQTQNYQFDLSLTSGPWMTLTLNVLTEGLSWYLEVSQTLSVSLYWLISISYGSSARQSQTLKMVKYFDFDLTCDVASVTPRSIKLGFPRQIPQIYRNPLKFCKSDQWCLSSEGAKNTPLSVVLWKYPC